MTQTFTYNPAGEIVTQATSNAAYDYALAANFTDSYAAPFETPPYGGSSG